MTDRTFPEKQKRPAFLLFLFGAACFALAAGFACSLKWGTAHVTWRELLEALTLRGEDKAHLYIRSLRLPRTLTACLVGMQLAIAGLLTQLATRNPLASPHVFGINAGAALAVVCGLAASAGLTATQSVLLAFAGAAAGAALIGALAGGGDSHPVRLALAGITIHFLLSSLTEGLILLNAHTTESVLFWLVGSVSQAGWLQARTLLPFAAGGMLLLLLLLPSLKLLALDDELAAGLGQKAKAVRAGAIVLVIVLAGSAVALCGPIGFVCLIVPHIARALAGHRLPVLIPLTALLGGALLVYADWLSRFIAFPFESPVGIVTSAVGAPFFIYMALRKAGGKP
jgi:iron complex transport system permease protein